MSTHSVTPQPTPGPLVVYSATQYCATKHEHELRLVTDGQTAYAYGPRIDCGAVWREGTRMLVPCDQPVHGEPCHGAAVFDIDRAGTWTSDPAARLLLARYGQKVEA